LARALLSGEQAAVARLQSPGEPMSQLNFSIRRAQRPAQRRSFNPREQVSLNTWPLSWTMWAITAVMVTTFLVVWYL
jgi:hypothetical protein